MSNLRKRFSRRDFLRIAGGTAISLPVLTACAKATEEATPAPETGGGETGLVEGQRGGMWLPPQEPEIKEIVTSVSNPNFFTVAPWHMMDDYGYAAEEGFEKYEFLVSDEALLGVVGKDITFALGEPDEVALSILEGVPVIGIACHRDKEWHMMGLSASIKKPEDLKGGKAIMGAPGTRVYAQRAAEIFNWSKGVVDPEKDLEPIVISGGSDAYNQAIVSDQVQIGMQYNRHMKSLLDAGCTFFIAGIFDYPQEVIICHQDTINESPRAVVNFLRAWLKSLGTWQDITMKDDIKAVMKEKHDLELSEEFDNSWVTQVEHMATAAMFRSVSMRLFLDDLAKYDIIPADSVYEDYNDMSFLRQAQSELIGMQWPPQNAMDVFTIYGLKPGDY